MKSATLIMLGMAAIGSSSPAAGPGLDAAHRELTEMNRLEQEAFVEGRCEELVALLADDISFFANGRRMTKEGVGMFCQRIPRPFPRTGEAETRITMTSEDAGYVVKRMTFPGTPRVEVVTKIWRKADGSWKIHHFQSTVTDLEPPSRD